MLLCAQAEDTTDLTGEHVERRPPLPMQSARYLLAARWNRKYRFSGNIVSCSRLTAS